MVKVLKCKLWNPLRISSSINIPEVYTLVIDGLHILGVQVGFQNFIRYISNEALF
jgi:hypothetical protein